MSLDVNISEPEEFNCIELHSCIKEIATMKGIEDFEYHVDFVCGKGDNYIANIFRVLIKESGHENNNVSVIVKTLVNTTRQELFHELHKREVMVYEEVIPKFISIQANLDTAARVVLPECLFSREEKSNEILILEDLLVNGYEMDDKLAKFEGLGYDQVSLIMKELAKFHALSFVYERKHQDDFNDIKVKFEDMVFQDKFLNKSRLRTYFTESFESSLKVVTDGSAKKKLVQIENKLLHTLQKYMMPTNCNVLCHGDFWINNILFKYGENEEPQLCFLDFQAMRYANPCTDIIKFLYICTDSKFRSEHFSDLKNDYYNSLKTLLLLHDLNINEIYAREDFDKDIEEMLPFGLLTALIELRIVTTTPEDEAILKGSSLVPGIDTSVVPGEDDLFKLRVNDVVNESINNGVLDKLFDIIRNL